MTFSPWGHPPLKVVLLRALSDAFSHFPWESRGRDQQFPWEMCGTPSHGGEREESSGKHRSSPKPGQLKVRALAGAEDDYCLCRAGLAHLHSTQACPKALGVALTQKIWDVSSAFRGWCWSVALGALAQLLPKAHPEMVQKLLFPSCPTKPRQSQEGSWCPSSHQLFHGAAGIPELSIPGVVDGPQTRLVRGRRLLTPSTHPMPCFVHG